MNRTQTVLLGVSALAAGAVIAGGVNLATAATKGDDTSPGPGPHGYGWGRDGGRPGDHEHGDDDHGPMGDHTPVTGSEKAKVADAVTAKYSDVTVRMVMKDEDGYDVLGTQAGRPVMVHVSKDLGTVELKRPGMGRGPGMGGPPGLMGKHTPVTGSERSKVTDAVAAKYKSVKVVAVLQDEDGSYDVMGVRGDAPVRVQVSKDLSKVTLDQGGPGMGMMHGRGHGGPHMWGPPPGFGPRGHDGTDDEDPEDGPAPATPSSTT